MSKHEFLTTKDLARRFRLSPRSITRLAREGQLPAPLRVSRNTLRWRADEIARWQELRAQAEA